MLEYWYKERRTLADFRRGPLGLLFDGLAARLKERGYSFHQGHVILGKCCLFNSYLIDQGITQCKKITPEHFESFIEAYLAEIRTTSQSYMPQSYTRGQLKHLFTYLVDQKIIKPPAPKPIPRQYRWILEPYLQYLLQERQLTQLTIQKHSTFLSRFLEGLGERVTPLHIKGLQPEVVEEYVKRYLKESKDNLRRLAAALRGFLHFCACQGYIRRDLSSVIPAIPSYRLASLPKGMEDSALQRVLNVIPKGSAVGARDYAIMLLMMAYGVRAKSVAELVLEDLDWPHSTIRFRGCKGGKEVVLPLMEAVGESILRYLHFRPETSLREVFLSSRAPFFPLSGLAVSVTVRKYMVKAGVKIPKSGSSTLRHSWAVRALAHDSPMKAIADVLGHKFLSTTFIYAKADLKTLRQVVMPWPKGR